MSVFTKMPYALAAIAIAVTTPAVAQQNTPWQMEEGSAHVIDMQGNMKVMKPTIKRWRP